MALLNDAQELVTMPFGIRELLARLLVVLRDLPEGAAQGAVIEIADLAIEAVAGRLLKAGDEVKLTQKEFDLLWLLASNAGWLVTQSMALEHVWGKSHTQDSQYLHIFVRQLRAKTVTGATSSPNPAWATVAPRTDPDRETPIQQRTLDPVAAKARTPPTAVAGSPCGAMPA